MRILFDENLPEGLDTLFVEHECSHVIRLGWAGIKNGNLLTKAEQAGYQVLLTFDKGIPNQQNLSGRRISILILQPEGQGVRAIRLLANAILDALMDVAESEVRVVTNRKSQSP